jgi:Ribonuclease G/E
MTRERRRESLQAMTCEACEECAGSGWVLSRDSLFLKIRKEIIDLTQGRPDGSLKIYLLGIVAQYMRENKERLEKQVGRSIEIFEDQTLPWEHYRIILE